MSSLKYKKPRSVKFMSFAIARILLTVASVSVLAVFIYYVAVEGWQTVIDWFNGKWFAFACVFAVLLGTIILWILSVFMKLKKLSDSYEE